MSKAQRVSVLLDELLTGPKHAQQILEEIVAKGMALGFDWHDIVIAVDEAERRTGLSLHPISSQLNNS